MLLEVLLESGSLVCGRGNEYGEVGTAQDVEEDLVPEGLADTREVGEDGDVEGFEGCAGPDAWFMITKESE